MPSPILLDLVRNPTHARPHRRALVLPLAYVQYEVMRGSETIWGTTGRSLSSVIASRFRSPAGVPCAIRSFLVKVNGIPSFRQLTQLYG